MEGGPRLAVTAEATAVVMIWDTGGCCYECVDLGCSILKVEVEVEISYCGFNGGDSGFL
jgi:hypothetical protein